MYQSRDPYNVMIKFFDKAPQAAGKKSKTRFTESAQLSRRQEWASRLAATLQKRRLMHIRVGQLRKCALSIFALVIACLAGPYAAHAGQTTDSCASRADLSARSERDWWKNAVIYEVYPRSFQDSNYL